MGEKELDKPLALGRIEYMNDDLRHFSDDDAFGLRFTRDELVVAFCCLIILALVIA